MSRFIRLDVFLILFASISWVTLTIFTIQLASPEWSEPLDAFFHGDKILVKNIFLGVFFLSVYLFFNDYTDKVEKARDLEWNVMATNLVCLFFHLIILYLEHYVKPPISLPVWLNFLNNFNILIGTVFSANCFFYFKKLILFERNITVNKLWRIFEIMIFSSILLTVFNVNISEPIVAFGLIIYSSFALYLSTHMRWVAFLKKYQKIKVIGHFMVYFILLCLILQNFFFESYAFGEDAHSHLLVIDCAHKFFLLSTFVFVLFYLTASVLILLFNLPTSEVFENNININKNFRKLSFQLNTKKDSNDIYKTLLDVSLSSSRSYIGFISLKGKTKRSVINCKHDIDERLALEIDDALVLEEKTEAKQTYIKNSAKSIQQVPGLIANRYLSVLRTPLMMNDEVIGSLVLLEKFEDAFEQDILEVILSYCVQASISVENIVLFDKTIENERFQEEIKIAKKVREKLLPEKLNFTNDFVSAIYSHSSDRIGGDYFEVAQLSNEKSVFVMADVSGNGTTAAFNMAQLKGIFQVTVQNIENFKDYPKAFNAALLTCLEQNSFVSMSMFLIDTKLKTIEHFRCGHLASYVLHENIIETLNPRGIGLGITNNNRLEELMEHMIVPYESGDKLFCYTDGLIEYTNNDNVPFGTEKLYDLLGQNIGKEPNVLVDNITKSFKDFLGNKSVSVDVTSICIKLP